MSHINVGLYLGDRPVSPCHVLYAQPIQGQPVAAVSIDDMMVYFSQESQIEQVRMVLAEATVRLTAAKEALFAEGIRIALEEQAELATKENQ